MMLLTTKHGYKQVINTGEQ